MDGGNEQRFAIKFCSKTGLSATVLVQKAYGNMAVNRSNVFRCYYRFRDGRELVEDDERGDRPKSTRTEVNIAAVGYLVKNDRRIATRMIAEYLNIHKTVVLRGFGKGKVVCKSCSTLLVTWSSHTWPIHYRDGRCRQIFFLTKLLREMRPGVLPMTPKQRDSVLNGLVRYHLGRWKWNSKGPASRSRW